MEKFFESASRNQTNISFILDIDIFPEEVCAFARKILEQIKAPTETNNLAKICKRERRFLLEACNPEEKKNLMHTLNAAIKAILCQAESKQAA